MNLTPEEKEVGRDNFHEAVGSDLTRREFLGGSLAAVVVSGGSGLGAYYFGYDSRLSDPVRVGIIGTGDEGGVLIGALSPDYVQVKAIADIRPYNIHRAFHGDRSSDNAHRARPGLMQKYGWSDESAAKQQVKVYDGLTSGGYEELLADPDIEAVIIALPLHLHAPVAIEALEAGKHVLTEKLMAHSVHEAKDMARVARQTGLLLATGHQRHYSILYDNAVHTIRWGLLGDLHHIRAQWHRGNLPGHDSWQPRLPDADSEKRLASLQKRLEKAKGNDIESLERAAADLELRMRDSVLEGKCEPFGYQAKTIYDPATNAEYQYSALEELIRWRLWNRTGGGLMAELGSHQLDAASIFISAMREDGHKVLPLSVSGVGGRHVFPLDREADDHVYCSYEFPAAGYEEDPNKKVVVTYSSINGNGFGGYGEVVMGTKGTLILEREQDVMLFKGPSTTTRVKVTRDSGGPTLTTTESPGDGAAVGRAALASGTVSRGYTEEIEHWAWCIRNPDPVNQPKCRPEVALADAVIALTTNIAIRERHPIEFQAEWFDIERDETPEGAAPSRKV